MTEELIPWLRAQLDEDERVARDALHPDAVNPGSWTTEHHNSETHSEPNRCHIAEDRGGRYWSVAHEVFIPNAEHIARHDPARVLAEVDAKRRILAEYQEALDRRRGHRDDLASAGALLQMVRVVKLLALPYADRPGYREEWRP